MKFGVFERIIQYPVIFKSCFSIVDTLNFNVGKAGFSVKIALYS